MRKRENGFTVIEILFVALLLGTASVIFFIQKHDLQVSGRDATRKTAINAMFYDLTKVYYKKNGYYPPSISSSNLSAIDPSLFVDPNGIKLGTAKSNYTYTPTNCSNDQCKGFTLRAVLENESDYVKTNADS